MALAFSPQRKLVQQGVRKKYRGLKGIEILHRYFLYSRFYSDFMLIV